MSYLVARDDHQIDLVVLDQGEEVVDVRGLVGEHRLTVELAS